MADRVLKCCDMSTWRPWTEAIDFYGRSLVLDPLDYKVLSNRSAAHLAVGQRIMSLTDAKRSTELNPDWHKGYYRLGCALMSLCSWELAVQAFVNARKCGQENAQVVRHRQKQMRFR